MTAETQIQTVTLNIDGKDVTVPKNMVVVDAAKEVDIEIPVFCYHQKLGPFGCCRMCLVEVEKMPKLTTACTLQVSEGMVVKTDTEKVKKAQEGVLEFTLLNHPLDCPVCDKGGECPLQDNTFKFGPPDTRMDYDRFNREKATPLSPVITIDRERCIACQRCTRYSEIIEKDQALVMLNRGFRNRVSTFNEQPYDTRYSGNVIDICPVGALTNTDFRFSARSWDLKNAETTCGHCGCNCNLVLGTRVNEMKRVTSQQNANDFVDDGWICDKGRWGYEFTRSKNRITQPRKRTGGDVPSVQEATSDVAQALKALVDQHGADAVGLIASPFALNEELYLYQKLFRLGLGTNNIDHKIYKDTPGLPVAHCDLVDLETAGLIVLVGSDPEEELPILDLRIKKAVTSFKIPLATLNDQSISLDRYARHSLRYDAGSSATALNSLSAVLGGSAASNVAGLNADGVQALANDIKQAGKVCFVYNPVTLSSPGIQSIKALLSVAGKLDGVQCLAMPAAPGTNALGAMDMGVLPDFYPGGLSVTDPAVTERFGEAAPKQPGLGALEMIEKARSGEIKALVVYRCNPVVEFPGGERVAEALQKLDLLVVHDVMETETSKLGHWVLPSNGPGFDEGTTTNIGGRVQQRTRGLHSEWPQDVRVLSKMMSELGMEAEYRDAHAVLKEISETVPSYSEISRKSIRKLGKPRGGVPTSEVMAAGEPASPGNGGLKLRVSQVLFRHDKILDAESSLAHQFQSSTVHLHPQDADSLGVKDGDEVTVENGGGMVKATAVVSGKCNPGSVSMPWVSDEQGLMNLASEDGSPSTVTVKK